MTGPSDEAGDLAHYRVDTVEALGWITALVDDDHGASLQRSTGRAPSAHIELGGWPQARIAHLPVSIGVFVD